MGKSFAGSCPICGNRRRYRRSSFRWLPWNTIEVEGLEVDLRVSFTDLAVCSECAYEEQEVATSPLSAFHSVRRRAIRVVRGALQSERRTNG